MAKHSITTHEPSKLDRLDTFVLAGVVTIFLTRAFLAISDYPQIGSDSLHIAHVLYGGAVLVGAFLFLLLASKPNTLIAALIGGIGFGLYIDEIGKFVTQDNDYFYEPAIGLIYISFLVIWFVARLIIVRNEGLPMLSPAEWPSKRWQRILIIGWASIQLFIGAVMLLSITLFGLREIANLLNIPRLGVIATIVTALFLGYGLLKYRRGESLAAAHYLRGATIFSIVAVFPFYYLNYPSTASLFIIPTVSVVIALSEVSFISLVKKLGARTH